MLTMSLNIESVKLIYNPIVNQTIEDEQREVAIVEAATHPYETSAQLLG